MRSEQDATFNVTTSATLVAAGVAVYSTKLHAIAAFCVLQAPPSLPWRWAALCSCPSTVLPWPRLACPSRTVRPTCRFAGVRDGCLGALHGRAGLSGFVQEHGSSLTTPPLVSCLQAGDSRAEEASFGAWWGSLWCGDGHACVLERPFAWGLTPDECMRKCCWRRRLQSMQQAPHTSALHPPTHTPPAPAVLKTNDPAGFTIVDVMAWGALGHAAAFYLLATHSLQVPRIPF